MKKIFIRMLILAALCHHALAGRVLAESQQDPLGRVSDPFGDPANYEFNQDERADKEFFHLGRFLMIGFDIGVGIYTGGLGRTTDPGAYIGGRILYFFDRSIAFEAAAHYSSQTDLIQNNNLSAEIATTLIPLTLGFRYYFDTRSSPNAIAVANPYLAFGGGAYLRKQDVLAVQNANIISSDNSQFGAYAAIGVEFAIYRRHLYLGLDVRYHLIFFADEDDTLGGNVAVGDRAGDFFAPAATLTYNF